MILSPQHGVNESAWAKRIEPISQKTWPAREVVALDGWRLRFSGGHSHRANSVAAFAFTGRDVEAAVAEVEAQYRRRGLKPMFQVTAAAAPANLAEVLTVRGFRAVTPSLVCVAEAAAVPSTAVAGQLCFTPHGDFDALVVEGSHSAADGRERLDTLGRIAVPLVRVTVLVEGHGVACGMAAAADGLAGINLMRTRADFRRQGFARSVLGAIAQWSLAQGCPTLTLTVERANAPARTLYRRAGFTTAYDYLYYVRD